MSKLSKKSIVATAFCFSLFSILAMPGNAKAEVDYEGGETGGDGGTYFNDKCPYHFQKGLGLRTGTRVDQVRNRCYNKYKTDVFTESTVHGGTGGTYHTLTCRTDFVLKGFYGRSANRIDQLGLICVEESDVINKSDPAENTYRTGSYGGDGGSYFSMKCGAGDAVSGIFGRSATEVDNIGIWCRDQPRLP